MLIFQIINQRNIQQRKFNIIRKLIQWIRKRIRFDDLIQKKTSFRLGQKSENIIKLMGKSIDEVLLDIIMLIQKLNDQEIRLEEQEVR
jgi:hypothetical protein